MCLGMASFESGEGSKACPTCETTGEISLNLYAFAVTTGSKWRDSFFPVDGEWDYSLSHEINRLHIRTVWAINEEAATHFVVASFCNKEGESNVLNITSAVVAEGIFVEAHEPAR